MTSCHRFPTVVIVDPSVADYPALIQGVASDTTKILILEQSGNGIEHITQALAELSGIESLHILSHGAAGTLHLGDRDLSWQTLAQDAPLLQAWAKSLAQHAEILLYGCEVAAGAVGQWFVQQLKQLTGAEIAASTTRTGSSALGGDWALDFRTGYIQTPFAFSAEARAAYAHVLAVFVDETFRGTDVVSPNWLFGVGAAVTGSPAPQNPFLTARGTAAASPGGIPGGSTGALNAAGEGALRLTNNIGDQSAFVLYNLPTPTSQGLTISFELFAYNPGSTAPSSERADGIGFFLVDGTTEFGATPTAGAFGGSLGYAQKNTSAVGPVPGIQGGFVGIGFDEFGNFASATDFAGGPIVRSDGNPAGRIPDSISIRAGVTAPQPYDYVVDSGTLPFGIDSPTAITRDGALRTVTVDITPAGLLSVRIDGNNDGDFNDAGETNPNLQGIRIADLNGTGAVPTTLKFGFASGTGRFNNIHEIRNLVVSILNDPPVAASFQAAVLPGSISPLPGFSATDPDAPNDQVDSFTILTLPDPSQGVLFVGNPTSGGFPVTAGINLTPAQIDNIYFQATPNFTGLSFTYTATDTRGSSATPATVTLTRINVPPTIGQPPTTTDSLVELPQNSLALVTGMSGSSTEATIASFTILTLPPADEGQLFLGNPSEGGTPVRAGQVLTPEQLERVFFQSSSTFSGSLFTYTATDSRGLVDTTPAVVRLIFNPAISPVICPPGLNETGNGRNNQLDGTPDSDTLRGLGGNDRLRGFDCPDVLMGGKGNDRVLGGAARDRLMGQQGRDVARGNDGNDVIDLGLGNDQGFGGKGNDVADGRRGNDQMSGQGGDDTLQGGRGKDRIAGNSNNDFLDGQQNDDVLRGGNGRDTLNGGYGNDNAAGDKGNDVADGRRGNDRLQGGGGDDTIRGGRGNDTITGNTNNDFLDGQQNNDSIQGGRGNDTINGGLGDDRMRGAQRRDRITARRGDDLLWGGGAKDVLLGQLGKDRISGNTQADRLNGGGGDDVMTGGGGNDIIRPGSGFDRIRYRSATHGVDRVIGFNVAQDIIDLRQVFDKPDYTSANPFSAYVRLRDGSSGAIVRVDADGGTSGGFVRLAILEGIQAGSLSQTNFLV